MPLWDAPIFQTLPQLLPRLDDDNDDDAADAADADDDDDVDADDYDDVVAICYVNCATHVIMQQMVH